MTVPLDPDRLDLGRMIRGGDLIFVAQLGSEPQRLTRWVLDNARALGGVRMITSFPLAPGRERLEADGVRFVAMDGFGINAALFAAGRLDIVPAHFGHYSALMRSGALKPDVALFRVTPPDEQGRRSLGPTVDHLRAALECARVRIAEECPALPWTFGDAEIDGAMIEAILPGGEAPMEWKGRPPGPIDFAIAEHVARLVPDRATIQYGVGSTPDAIAAKLTAKRDLGLHSGSFADSLIDLIESGAVSNRYKEIDAGLSVATALYGSTRLYRFVHRNSGILLREAPYTHSQSVLAHFERLFAINSALEVDLTGQVGSEAIDGRYIGAIGGQTDFQRAAMGSPLGRGIVTLASTAGRSGRSRIVRHLSGPVSAARADADVVVTEHGIAELRGRTLAERARALIAIAHPDHRRDLAREAERLA